MRRGVTSTDSHLMGTSAAEKMSLTVWEIFHRGSVSFFGVLISGDFSSVITSGPIPSPSIMVTIYLPFSHQPWLTLLYVLLASPHIAALLTLELGDLLGFGCGRVALPLCLSRISLIFANSLSFPQHLHTCTGANAGLYSCRGACRVNCCRAVAATQRPTSILDEGSAGRVVV